MNSKDALILRTAREVIRKEAKAVGGLSNALGRDFCAAVKILAASRGKAVLVGIGKSGLIARKIAATLSSTGTQSVYLHPVESLHGDLGMISEGDTIIALSYSGETEETTKLMALLSKQGLKVISITNNPASRLALASDITLDLGVKEEACPMNIVPTSSTTAMLALGDAIAVVLMRLKGFTSDKFARLHPGGNLGKLLNIRVADLMRKGRLNPVVKETSPLKAALKIMTATAAGAASVTDARGRLRGFFTDGDLRRHLQTGSFDLNIPLSAVMTRNPLKVYPETMAMDAARIISERKVDNLPVIDKKTGRPVGILDEKDLLREGLL
ncbi:MAG TPA: KpsF/GutQ family sugar-phosphate isomerase [Elusimicrobia bacterium]|nr:KpsF/GutQ family sugar-phosphate isomerase [Elusimicrobiota bacterium]